MLFRSNPAVLTIQANNVTKTYGTAVTPTGFTTTGLVNGDSVSSVTLTPSGGTAANAAVGGYSIAASNAIGSSTHGSGTNASNFAANYTISYLNGSLTVNPAALTITANSTSKTYGDTVTFTGTEFTKIGRAHV